MAKKKELMKNALQELFKGSPTPEELSTMTPKAKEVFNTLTDEAKENALALRRKKKVGRPKKGEVKNIHEAETRATFVAKKEKLKKIQYIALQGGIMQKEIIDMAFDFLINRYEAAHGEIIIEEDKSTGIKNLFK